MVAQRESPKAQINLIGGFILAKYHVGVDVGKDRHHVCIRDLSKDTYYKTFPITNDRNGFMELVHSLEKLSAGKDDFLVGIEACSYGLNLSYFLMGVGFKLVEVNPFRAGQFRKALSGSLCRCSSSY